MTYRQLTTGEVDILLSQNCYADDWTTITVKEGFSPGNILNSRFEGSIKIGSVSGYIEIEKNISKKCGIYNSFLCNCEVDDQVFISDVKNLSNYLIESNVAISNVGSLIVTGESAFGNGTEIEVLNEGGGRELPIFDLLSSQIGYLAVLYRHDTEFISKLLGLIRAYCKSKISDRGVIHKGARILDSNVIKNVMIGSCSIINGASLLEEGTIRSCQEDPAFIGTGVVAKKFILMSGSRVEGGVIIEKTFVGQGVKMGKQFSAENSLFFANSEAFHGEACSLFAGPYTVSHHKSTLLIASLVSFFNAGSGTNQSNHMYKLGPIHQGILERGSKTGSFSYLLLPAHIGPFTVVMGKHYANFDTSDFPFSYISEEKGKSELIPAMNLFTVGTRRDSDKWPTRDRRKDPFKIDLIHFDFLNPYIAGKILNGINILNDLAEKNDKKPDYVSYKGININRLLLKTTRKYYEMAVKIYIGQEVVKRIGRLDTNSSISDLEEMLAFQGTEGEGKWVEICGLFSPASKIDELIDSVNTGKITSIRELGEYLTSVYSGYSNYSWIWCASLIARLTGDKPDGITTGSLIRIINDWKTTAIKLNNMILKDAEKEYDSGSRIGFGIDGDVNTAGNDFIAVRGLYNENKFVIGLQKESMEIEDNAARLTEILEKLK